MADKPKSVTLKLEFPFEHEGREYKELTFRRMKMKDAMAGEGEESEARAGYMLYAALADVPVTVIEELDLFDFEEMVEQVAPLMGKRGTLLLQKLKAAEEAPRPSTVPIGAI